MGEIIISIKKSSDYCLLTTDFLIAIPANTL